MHKIKNLLSTLSLFACVAFAPTASAIDITGAGATFPYPVYSKWAQAYKQATGTGMNYQSIGSGGGIKQIKANTVDFGASDMPLKDEELKAEGLLQFPAIIGGVVPVINLAGVQAGAMKLTGKVLGDIYLGKITKWNDPAIVALNPAVKFPDTEITVVHRADGSGTTFLFTDYLAKVNPMFKSMIGSSTAVKWITGIGGKGNEGVAANVQRLKGSIGYVEYVYAKSNHMTYIQLQNAAGQFVLPDNQSFKAAANEADWKSSASFGVVLTNQAGKKSWPITGASFILVHAKAQNPERTKEVIKFFDWAFQNGEPMATQLDYVVLPAGLIKTIQTLWKSQLKNTTGQSFLP